MTSNRRGFEYAELGPQRLPGSPPSYLDISPSDDARLSYGFQLLEIGGEAFVRYSRHLRIEPNDSQTDRGAYLSAGFLSRRSLTMHKASNCIDAVSQIYGHLKSLVGADSRVGPDFVLSEYAGRAPSLEDALESSPSPLLLLDVLLQGLNGEGPSKWKPQRPIFLPSGRSADKHGPDRHLFYFDKGAPGAQLRVERERERLRGVAEKLVLAASYADLVQDEWSSYQAFMQERLPSAARSGKELRALIEEVEALTRGTDSVRGAGRERGSRVAPTAATAMRGVYPQSSGGAESRHGSGKARGQGRRAGPRRRVEHPHTGGFRLSLRGVSLGVGTVVVLGLIVALALRFVAGWSVPNVTEPTGRPAALARQAEPPGRGESVEGTPSVGVRGVAQERAALGESNSE